MEVGSSQGGRPGAALPRDKLGCRGLCDSTRLRPHSLCATRGLAWHKWKHPPPLTTPTLSPGP